MLPSKIKPLENSFLKYRGIVDTGSGNINEDIQKARQYIANTFK